MEILDGKLVSASIKKEVREEIASLAQKTAKKPGLTVIIVGEDPASRGYVRSKERTALKIGINGNVIRYGPDVPADKLIQKIKELNLAEDVDGILVQLPLPNGFNTWQILDHLDPEKDVDGFHPLNLGKVLLNRAEIYPCTPAGIFAMFRHYNIAVSGKSVAVVGRSFIVGKPLANMFTNGNATVTLCHSKTRDLPGILARSDIIVAAIGSPGFIKAEYVKEGAILVDVGMNYLEDREMVMKYCSGPQKEKFAEKGYGIAGDIHADAVKKSSFYTPVPGGVGLMTVSMLMYNTLQIFKKRLK